MRSWCANRGSRIIGGEQHVSNPIAGHRSEFLLTECRDGVSSNRSAISSHGVFGAASVPIYSVHSILPYLGGRVQSNYGDQADGMAGALAFKLNNPSGRDIIEQLIQAHRLQARERGDPIRTLKYPMNPIHSNGHRATGTSPIAIGGTSKRVPHHKGYRRPFRLKL